GSGPRPRGLKARPGAPANDATGTRPRPAGSEVELAGEVLQAAVDLYGDHAVARAQPAGDLQRGEKVGAGRGAGEYPLGARGPAGRFERLGLRDGDDLVVVRGVEQRRAVADAAALDVVDPRRAARQPRRPSGPAHAAGGGWPPRRPAAGGPPNAQ